MFTTSSMQTENLKQIHTAVFEVFEKVRKLEK